jgi:hypothetical protein
MPPIFCTPEFAAGITARCFWISPDSGTLSCAYPKMTSVAEGGFPMKSSVTGKFENYLARSCALVLPDPNSRFLSTV